MIHHKPLMQTNSVVVTTDGSGKWFRALGGNPRRRALYFGYNGTGYIAVSEKDNVPLSPGFASLTSSVSMLKYSDYGSLITGEIYIQAVSASGGDVTVTEQYKG